MHLLFSNLSQCIEMTGNCHNQGTCSYLPQYNHYECICISQFLKETNCQTNFYQIWHQRDSYFWVIGLCLSVYYLLVFVPEVIVHVRSRRKYFILVTKVSILLSAVLRVASFSHWAYTSITENQNLSNWLTGFLLITLFQACVLTSFCFIVAIWIDIYTKTTNLTNDTSPHYFVIKTILIGGGYFFSVTCVILAVLYIITRNPIVITIYYILILLFLLPTLTWSLYSSIKIHNTFNDADKVKGFLYKNKMLILADIFGLIYLALLALYALKSDLWRDPWHFLIILTLVRLTEFAFVFPIIVIIQTDTHFLSPLQNWKKVSSSTLTTPTPPHPSSLKDTPPHSDPPTEK